MQGDGHRDADVQHARVSGPATGPDGETTLQRAAAIVAETVAWHRAADQGALLFEIVNAATRFIPGCDGAALLSVERSGRARSLAVAGAAVSWYSQEDLFDEGPMLHLSSTHPVIAIPDLTSEPRWPAFRSAAIAAGIRSLMCRRVVVATRQWGWLFLTSGQVGAFAQIDDSLISIFASQVQAALHTAGTIDNLQQALASREVIGRAKGILMTRHEVSDNEAFAILRRESQNSNVRLRRVSEMLCRDKRLPSEGSSS